MLDQTKVAKAGRILFIDQGSYSDYYCVGIYLVEKDFTPYDILQDYLNENPSDRKDYEFDHHHFLEHLITNGYVKEIEHDRLYMGGYGSIDEVEYL